MQIDANKLTGKKIPPKGEILFRVRSVGVQQQEEFELSEATLRYVWGHGVSIETQREGENEKQKSISIGGRAGLLCFKPREWLTHTTRIK